MSSDGKQCWGCGAPDGTVPYGQLGAYACSTCLENAEIRGRIARSSELVKRPNYRWERDTPAPGGASWRRGRLRVIVSFDDGSHHLSVRKLPEVLPSDEEVKEVLRDFGMELAQEDNSVTARTDTRHFWLKDESAVS